MVPEIKRVSKRQDQPCPLCGEMQEPVVAGTMDHEDPALMLVDHSRGYSFCNCRNIWYTDWANMRQSKYDKKYSDRYDNSVTYKCLSNYFVYNQIIRETHPTGSILEIGCINTGLLDQYKKHGWTTYALDIIPHDFIGNRCISANFEEWVTDQTFDVIWASHIFEHFKDPVAMVEKCHNLLNPGGYLFVSMPDPYFIDYHAVHRWGHWHLDEHHIMWDMESFCDLLKEKGFTINMARHNADVIMICIGDMHIIARKSWATQ